jgi:hypothetical protein
MRNTQSDEINELIAALSKAQGEMNGASKDSNNPFFKSKYADLASVWNACREPLSKYGLAIVQAINDIDGSSYLITTLAHSSGQYMRSMLPLKFDANKSAERVNPLQQLGSCITYLRRYALAAIVGIAPDDDDDGNSATTYQPTTKVNNQITKDQGLELMTLLSKCTQEFRDSIFESIKRKFNADSVFQLTQEIYYRLKCHINEQIEKQFEEKKDDETEHTRMA